MNPTDKLTIRCLVYADKGRFMGIADVVIDLKWITKNAEEISTYDLMVLRKVVGKEK